MNKNKRKKETKKVRKKERYRRADGLTSRLGPSRKHLPWLSCVEARWGGGEERGGGGKRERNIFLGGLIKQFSTFLWNDRSQSENERVANIWEKKNIVFKRNNNKIHARLKREKCVSRSSSLISALLLLFAFSLLRDSLNWIPINSKQLHWIRRHHFISLSY